MNRHLISQVSAIIILAIAVALFSINIYGLFQDIRVKDLDQVSPDLLRFPNDNYLTYEDSIEKISSIKRGDDYEYAIKANKLVQNSMTHVDWNKVDRTTFHQLVPLWENYMLHLIGRISSDPQLKRYHFVDYKRSLRRGIGICGDASMVLSQILDKRGINNKIISYKGHVITEATLANERQILLDPDFGVELTMSNEELSANPSSAYPFYIMSGYSEKEAASLSRIYGTDYAIFDNVYSFMPKRYIFEYASYILIWLIPTALLLLSLRLLGVCHYEKIR